MFLYKIHLHILQLEEYQLDRFFNWIFKNYTKRKLENKKPLVWTPKAKQIYFMAILYAGLLVIIFTFIWGMLGLILGIILASQDYIFLALGVLTKKPYEIYNRYATSQRTLNKILSLKKLKVIGISGSYAKTSTKDILYSLLKTQYKVIKTPLSYNTLFGIAKVVDYELDKSHDFFICEMGEYKIGEVAELCQMTNPSFGIITGINEQHIERFVKIENTIKAVFEVADYIDNSIPSKNGFVAINTYNKLISDNYNKYSSNFIHYSFDNGIFSIKNISMTENGSSFDIILDKNIYHAKTNLVGKSHLLNILAASTLAFKLGISKDNILKVITELKPSAHRLDLKKLANGNLLLDDSYSSNVNGFKEALELLSTFKDYKKILVTPGIIELGSYTKKIHQEIGELAGNSCDHIILVGKNDRTESIEYGASKNDKKNDNDKIMYIDSIKTIWTELEKFKNEKYIVLFENDLPDNY